MDASSTWRPTALSRPTATLLFDFDGTVALGNGPLLAYARSVADRLPGGEEGEFLDEIDRALAAPASGLVDGYDLVRFVAEQHGIRASALQDAYRASRTLLATPAAPVVAPARLAEFLDEHRLLARAVLATNAPATRIEEALNVLGVARSFDEIHTEVGKPHGLGALIETLLADGPVLSIGDIWANDLAPAQERGATTALVAAAGFVPADATPTFRAERLDELYDDIAAWLAKPSSDSRFIPLNRKAKS